MSEFAALFQAVREAAPASIWSMGVELARLNAAVCERRSESEIVFRVSSARGISASVQIWPEDEDWHCDCARSLAACEHVAAAVITLRRASESGQELTPAGSDSASIRYEFSSEQTTSGPLLRLSRFIELKGQRFPIPTTLHAAAREAGLSYNPSKSEAEIDTLLTQSSTKNFSSLLLGQVLRRLQGAGLVFIDDRTIQVGRPVVPFIAVAEDEGMGNVRIYFAPALGVETLFCNGAVIAQGKLCPSDEPDLTPPEVELSRGKIFQPALFNDVASRIIPSLERKMKVEVRTHRLPRNRSDEPPHIIVQTSGNQEVMAVLPLLVYGHPPYARVDGDRLTLIGETTAVPERDLKAEHRLVTAFQSKTGLSVGRKVEYRAEMAVDMLERLQNSGVNIAGDSIAAFRRLPPLEVNLTTDGETFDIRFTDSKGALTADSGRVFAAWMQGMERVSLQQGGWAPIPKAWLDAHGHAVLELIEARDRAGRLPAHTRPSLAHLCDTVNAPYPKALSAFARSLDGRAGIPSVALPSDLTATLRPYQKQGVDWLCFLKSHALGALLADDMGLGKTLQTLCALEGPSLVVAPTSVLPNWQKEIARFRPALNVSVYHGTDRELDQRADITLTSYALLRRDVALLEKLQWNTVVLDEAQNIKNAESQSAQAAFSLKAKFRVALTGTPVENRVEDLWSVFHFLNPGLLGSRTVFSERYGSGAPTERFVSLHTKIKPFLLRRLKRQVAPELPPRTELVLYCDLESSERVAYDAVLAATRKDVVSQLQAGGSVLAALEALLRLRQAACHSGLLPGKSAPDSSKIRLLLEKLEELVSEGHKALIFSQWTSLLDLVEPHLQNLNWNYLRIDGSTPAQDRSGIVDSFQKSSGPPFLLMTLKAGGVGLNLTAADHVFLLDPWWNPAAEDQAADRAHRIGQDRPVFVHRLVARDTVEERILALQESKRQSAAAALSGTGGGTLTRDDLLGLIQ
jgi:superfamily II DNA or RNA helicase